MLNTNRNYNKQKKIHTALTIEAKTATAMPQLRKYKQKNDEKCVAYGMQKTSINIDTAW